MRAYTSKTKDSFVTALENTITYFEDFGHKVKLSGLTLNKS
jgi:hypothetical protein